MGKKIFQKEINIQKKISRNLKTHRLPLGGKGCEDLYFKLKPHVLSIYSPRFDTKEEALEWKYKNSEGNSKIIETNSGSYRVYLKVNRGMPFRERLPWDYQNEDQQAARRKMRKDIERKGFQGHAKPYRRSNH